MLAPMAILMSIMVTVPQTPLNAQGKGGGKNGPPKNLKVLTPENFMAQMQTFPAALGVENQGCNYCHEADRSLDTKPTKVKARQMIEMVADINAKFGEPNWRPIILVDQHQEPRSVFELYRAADFCLVNSLHDGMNLVAKEFVAARDDEDGVLILSTFAGASRELAEAVLINPFDVNETAEAMEIAMRMGREERRDRMSLMRRTVQENNVYRWAGRMLMDAARIRQRQNLPPVKPRYGT